TRTSSCRGVRFICATLLPNVRQAPDLPACLERRVPQGRKKRFGHCTGGHYPNTLSPVKTFRQNFFRKLLQKDGGEARQASPPLSDVDLVSRVLFFPASREG